MYELAPAISLLEYAQARICVDGDINTVKTKVPVKSFTLYVEDVDGVEFEDNCLDLVPGDTQAVVTWKYYGME